MEARRTSSRPAPLFLGGLLLLFSLGVMDAAHQHHHYLSDPHGDADAEPHSLCAVLHAGVVVETPPAAPAPGDAVALAVPAVPCTASVTLRFAPAAPRAPPAAVS